MSVIIVKGRPVSVNAERARQTPWRNSIATAARLVFANPLNDNDLRVIITFFYERLPDFDTDNISKPICDALQGIVYHNDHQVMERYARRRDLNGAFHLKGVPLEIAVALTEGDEFVSIVIENVGAGVAVI